MSFRGRGAIEIVEQAYAPAGSDEEWLRGIGETAARVLGTGLPVEASIHRPRPGDVFGAVARVFTRDDPTLAAMFLDIYAAASAVISEEQLLFERLRSLCQTSSMWVRESGLPMSVQRDTFATLRERYGVADALDLQAADPSGQTVLLAIMLPEETALHPRTRQALLRVTTHLSTALRLRRTLEAANTTLSDASAAMADAEAILEQNGKVVDATGKAKSANARERLRDAAMAIDRARGRLARERPEEAMELWRGLVAGRWSVIEVTDSDARRYWVARRNEPAIAEDRRLTRREGQVVGMAALGLSDDMVAYSLGLAEATIRTHLRRGMKKLGVRQRKELIALHAALIG